MPYVIFRIITIQYKYISACVINQFFAYFYMHSMYVGEFMHEY